MSDSTSKWYKAAIVAAIVLVIAVGVLVKVIRRQRVQEPPPSLAAAAATAEEPTPPATTTPAEPTSAPKRLPAVIDLGMGKCIPCKAMKPILEELAEEYRGRARIEIIDIGDNPGAAERFKVMLIPTQVFIDEHGNETYRHEGFMPRDEIVAQLEKMGVRGPVKRDAGAPPVAPRKAVPDHAGQASRTSMPPSPTHPSHEASRVASKPPQTEELPIPAAGATAPAGQSQPPSSGATCACGLPGWVQAAQPDSAGAESPEHVSDNGGKENAPADE